MNTMNDINVPVTEDPEDQATYLHARNDDMPEYLHAQRHAHNTDNTAQTFGELAHRLLNPNEVAYDERANN